MSTRQSKLAWLVLLFLLLGIGPLFFCAEPSAAASQGKGKPMVMRMAHYQPEQRMLMVGAKWWADQVEARTGGRIIIKHYFSGKLAKAREIMPLVMRGGVEMGTVGAGYYPSEFPLVSSLSEYPWETFDQAAWVITRLYEEVPALDAEWKKNNIAYLCHGVLGAYGIVSKKPFQSLPELKGRKVRAFGKYVPKRLAKLGMVPVVMPSSEIFETLSKGGVDGSLSNLDQHRSLGLWEVAKYHLKGDFFPVVWNSAAPIMNLTLFNSLDPDLRKILIDLKAEYLKKNIQLIKETDAVDEKFLKDNGVKFSTVSEKENKRIRQVTLEVFESVLSDMKEQKKELGPSIDALQAALAKLNAEYFKTHP